MMPKLKGFTFLLLLLLLVLCSGVHQCDARSGKRWSWRRSSRAPPSTSALRRKGKAKSSSSHKQNGKGSQSPYQPSPTAPASPSGDPVQRNGSQAPAMPAPRGGGYGYPPPPPPPLQPSPSAPSPPAAASSQGTVFNVVEFGAKGDGVTDDTQAFQSAWAAACKVEASTVLVPSEHEFVVGPVSFSGPYCKPNILFQLDGTILAQTSARVWGSGLLQWLEFTKLTGIAIQGSGVINGRGQEWWTYSDPNDDDNDDAYYVELDKMPQIKPTALRFYGSSNVTILPVNIKSLAGSVATLANWLTAWAITMTASLMLNWSNGGTFAIYAAVSTMALIFVCLWVPETKGRTLEEIAFSFR